MAKTVKVTKGVYPANSYTDKWLLDESGEYIDVDAALSRAAGHMDNNGISAERADAENIKEHEEWKERDFQEFLEAYQRDEEDPETDEEIREEYELTHEYRVLDAMREHPGHIIIQRYGMVIDIINPNECWSIDLDEYTFRVVDEEE